MAYLFGDSFDMYASFTDLALGRWDSGGVYDSMVAAANTAFGVGQAIHINHRGDATAAGTSYVKAFASTETTVFFSIRSRYPFVGSGPSTAYAQIIWTKNGVAQVTTRFNADGSITFHAGGAGGTVLGTIPAGVFALNTWYSLQGKIVCNASTGTITIRANGSTSDAYAWTGLNTGTGINGIRLGGCNNADNIYHDFDDLLIWSGATAAPNDWCGDVRALQQAPTVVTQAQFSAVGTVASTVGATTGGAGNKRTLSANTLYTGSLQTVPTSGTVSGGFVNCTQYTMGQTGHVHVGVFASDGTAGAPLTMLAKTTTPITNPTAGLNAYTLASPISVTKGQKLYFAALADFSFTVDSIQSQSVTAYSLGSTLYSGGIPSSAAGVVAATGGSLEVLAYGTIVPNNSAYVQEPIQDGDTSYLVSGTVGQEDIFTMAPISTAYTVIGVSYFILWRRADAGARTVQLSVAANGSADTPEIVNATLPLSYNWNTVFMPTDPTGAGWTPTTVNGAHIGISVTA